MGARRVRVLRFLFESDYPPWPFQVVWKLLAFTLAALIVYAGLSATSTEGSVVLYVFAACFVVIGLFGKLGEQ